MKLLFHDGMAQFIVGTTIAGVELICEEAYETEISHS